MEISEHSDSTTTPEGQERLVFLRRKAAYIEKKIEAARGYLIDFNNKRVDNVKKRVDEFKAESHKKLKSKMKTFLQKAKMSNDAKTLAIKAVEDPRGGITRRYANYTPINRFQYTEDTVHMFYPNVSDQFHKKMTEEWKMARKNVLLKHRIAQDMTLCMYLAKFGETSEVIETFKKFRNSECEDKTIQRRFKDLREKFIKKKTVFRVPGCSVTQHEEMNEHSIVKTHKELFCRRCEVYDCGLHGILDFSNFIQPNKYSTKDMRTSYNEMVILYESPAKRAESKKVICGETCYCAEGSNNNMEVTLKDFVTSKLKLALQIFKFDPCNIRLYFNKDEITCKQIFLYLKSEFAEHPHTAHTEENLLENSRQEIITYKKGIKKMKNKKDMKYFFPNWKNLKESLSGTIAIDYRPCYHLFYDHATTEEEQHCMNSNCVCFERGLCDKYCGCDLKKCQIRKKGCDCSTSCATSVCPCYSINTECDPDLCKCCFNVKGRDKTNNCQNQMICFGKTKFCRVGPSDVCSGLGLFTLDRINKGEFVYNYIGELISWEEADFREKRNKHDPEMYLSTVSDEFVVDAKYRGNKARFINHGKEHANLVARNMSSGGLYYFCFFAKCDIEPGSELLFDYEGGGSALKEQFEWITNPRMPKTITHKEIPRLPPSEAKEVCLTTGLKVFYEPQIQIKIQLKVKKLKKRELINLEDELMEEEDMGYYTAGSDDAQTKKRLKRLPEIKQEESESKSKSKTQSICLSASEEHQDENSENDEILVRKERENGTEEPKYHYIFDIQRESSDEEGEIKEKFFKFLDIKHEKKSESESEAVESDKEHEHVLNG